MTTNTAVTTARVERAAENLFRIERELKEAEADVALLERLKKAEDRAKSLRAERTAASDKLTAARDAEDKARKANRFAAFQSIEVRDRIPGEGLLRSSFEITYSRLTYDMNANASYPQSFTVMGFKGLPDDAFAYLLYAHPEKVPAKIMALAPNDPQLALERYFVALRRGFVQA